MKSLKEEKEKVRRTGAERLGLRNFYHSPESYLKFFFFSGKEENERKKDEKMAGEEKKRPGLSQRVGV